METKAIEKFLKTLSTEKLKQMYDFNDDGNMEYVDTCSCILGVASSNIPHKQENCPASILDHYHKFRASYPQARKVEDEYLSLYDRNNNNSKIPHWGFVDKQRQQNLAKLLEAELQTRA